MTQEDKHVLGPLHPLGLFAQQTRLHQAQLISSAGLLRKWKSAPARLSKNILINTCHNFSSVEYLQNCLYPSLKYLQFV